MLSITGITYVTMVLVFLVLGSSRPFVDALVPTTGFFSPLCRSRFFELV